MPYIDPEARAVIGPHVLPVPLDVGELTFVLYRECMEYVGQVHRQANFQTWAEVLGALEATKLELYRRHVAQYEDRKREVNGDV